MYITHQFPVNINIIMGIIRIHSRNSEFIHTCELTHPAYLCAAPTQAFGHASLAC